jgi:hypothetical protein
MKQGVSEAVRAAGGAIFAVTSEPQRLADEARRVWAFDFPAVGDPHHEIAGACRERGWLDLYVNERTHSLGRAATFAEHPKGYFQPGVLAVTRAGRVAYRWRGRPTRKNMGGASERPAAAYAWARIQQGLAEPGDRPDAALDVVARQDLDHRGIPWPLFVTLLVANGNFLRPRPFPFDPEGKTGPERAPRAIAKVPVFLGAWAAAFVFLPAAWVLAALAGWAALITPGIVEMHREFQSVPEESS